MNSSTIKKYCKDIEKWPDSWKIVKQDIECGNKIIESVFIPFIEFIINKGFARRREILCIRKDRSRQEIVYYIHNTKKSNSCNIFKRYE